MGNFLGHEPFFTLKVVYDFVLYTNFFLNLSEYMRIHLFVFRRRIAKKKNMASI